MKRRSAALLVVVMLCTLAGTPARAAFAFAGPISFLLGGMFNAVAMATADFNADGRLDVALAGQGSGGIQVRLNSGGLFPTASYNTFLPNGQAHDVAAADVNGDGRPDLLVGNTISGTPNIAVLIGNGDGTFTPPMQNVVPGGSGPVDIAVADVNGDGRIDVLLTKQVSATVDVRLGTGTPTLSAGPAVPVAFAANDITISDLDFNGLPDAIIVGSGGMQGLLNTGGGSFSPQSVYPAGANPTSVRSGDLDNDGRRDAVIGNFVSAGIFNVTAYRSIGNGVFTSMTATAAGPGTFGGSDVALADIDADGRLDAASVNPSLNDLRVLIGTGTGSFNAAVGFPTMQTGAAAVVLADFDNDGRVDAAVANGSDRITIFLQGTPPSAPLNLSVARGYQQLALSWAPPASGDQTGYKIYRGATSGGETFLAAVGNVTSYTDVGLGNGATYYYKVSATNGAGEGPLSNEAFATTFTIPSAPVGVSAAPGTAIGDVVVSWQPPADNGGAPIGFILCRLPEASGPRYCLNLDNVTSFTDSANLPLHTYRYEVAAVNIVGQGPWSAQACSKPFPWLSLLGC